MSRASRRVVERAELGGRSPCSAAASTAGRCRRRCAASMLGGQRCAIACQAREGLGASGRSAPRRSSASRRAPRPVAGRRTARPGRRRSAPAPAARPPRRPAAPGGPARCRARSRGARRTAARSRRSRRPHCACRCTVSCASCWLAKASSSRARATASSMSGKSGTAPMRVGEGLRSSARTPSTRSRSSAPLRLASCTPACNSP